MGKGLADDSLPFRWSVTVLAFRATYGVGLLGGACLLIANNPSSRSPQIPYRGLIRLCLIPLTLAVLSSLIGALLFLGIAAIFGARVAAGFVGILLVVLMAGILAAAVGGLGIYLALRTRSSEAVQGTFPLFFALLFFSSAFFPRETMDGWFRVVADLNPISYLAEGMRAPIVDGFDWPTILIGLGIAIGLAVIAIAAAAAAFRRSFIIHSSCSVWRWRSSAED